MSARKCGECTACCTVMEIDELAKPAGEPCVHLDADGRGCSIYAERPLPCRGFLCFWLAEGDPRVRGMRRVGRWIMPLSLREDERPDKSGIMFHTSPESLLARRGFRLLHAREVWPGAFHTQRGRALLERLSETHVIALGKGDETKPLIGPSDRVRLILAELDVVADVVAAGGGSEGLPASTNECSNERTAEDLE